MKKEATQVVLNNVLVPMPGYGVSTDRRARKGDSVKGGSDRLYLVQYVY